MYNSKEFKEIITSINTTMSNPKRDNKSEDFNIMTALQNWVSNELEKFRPVYMGVVFRRCSSKNCGCQDKSQKLSEVGHGPYVTATYEDRQGKRKVKSLGLRVSRQELIILGEELFETNVKWYDYVITQRKFDSASEEKRLDYKRRSLLEREFEDYYKVSIYKDKLSRPSELLYDRDAYLTAEVNYRDKLKVFQSSYAIDYGVGNLNGLETLTSLLADGIYRIITPPNNVENALGIDLGEDDIEEDSRLDGITIKVAPGDVSPERLEALAQLAFDR